MFEAIIQLLRNDGSIVINKKLIQTIGLNNAIIYSELLSRYCYFRNHDMLDEDGWFFNTIEDLESATTLSGHIQRNSIKQLIELGLIESETKNKGMQKLRFFRFNDNPEILINLLSNKEENTDVKKLDHEPLKNEGLEPLKIKHSDVEKFNINNTNINNTNNNTNSNKVTKKSESIININKSNNKSKRSKDIITMKGMINTFSNNDILKGSLLDYFNLRVKKGLQVNQWKIILDDLKKYGGNDDLVISKINNSIAGGYMQIIPYWEKEKSKKPTFDNTANNKVDKAVVNMDKEERKEYENNLAKDDDGNLLTF